MAATFTQPAAPMPPPPTGRPRPLHLHPDNQIWSKASGLLEQYPESPGSQWGTWLHRALVIIVLASSKEQKWTQHGAWKGQIQGLRGQSLLLLHSEQVYA